MINFIILLFLISHHIEEGSPEHIAKNSIGVVSIFAQRDILSDIGKKYSLFVGPFAEFSFFKNIFSIQGVVPFGLLGSNFYFSDIIATLKSTPPIFEDNALTLILSSTLPTGQDLAGSGHLSLMPAVAGEFHIHTKIHIHIHSLLGAHLSIGSFSSDETHSNHNNSTSSHHKINYLFPHSEKEIIGHIGFMVMLKKLGVDVRPSFFFEDLKMFVLQPQVGLTGNIPISQKLDFLFNLYGFWALSGIRKGKGIGFIGYLKF
ncbi:hypothetical protein HRbin19_01466 [bacterium HR19]|nr:hypothetical protein HRbin19_01466 [bacterium HR19]